jgi:hypothetical protein
MLTSSVNSGLELKEIRWSKVACVQVGHAPHCKGSGRLKIPKEWEWWEQQLVVG